MQIVTRGLVVIHHCVAFLIIKKTVLKIALLTIGEMQIVIHGLMVIRHCVMVLTIKKTVQKKCTVMEIKSKKKEFNDLVNKWGDADCNFGLIVIRHFVIGLIIKKIVLKSVLLTNGEIQIVIHGLMVIQSLCDGPNYKENCAKKCTVMEIKSKKRAAEKAKKKAAEEAKKKALIVKNLIVKDLKSKNEEIIDIVNYKLDKAIKDYSSKELNEEELNKYEKYLKKLVSDTISDNEILENESLIKKIVDKEVSEKMVNVFMIQIVLMKMIF